MTYFQLLDLLLGKDHDALFRRAELKTLVDFHGNEVLISQPFVAVSSLPTHLSPCSLLACTQAGKGGELTRDETTIIAGALELSEKTARDAMTPISETFAIDINAKLDRFL